ncbi:MAG: DUF2752 domain-containing protein [Clostridium baratii]|uniref:DUF2752 domain-containing protein n=1 Tax=Clostridium baratii str. Sullivan TaxID=1415775 RepID=A0A0A7FXA7_9CLOT|nr:DUF2752 domain-containing protein [Clostridium baratii]AIY83575.1 hypothetical protein U729_994 [Clostridium baratii str. Sullivan]MBS6007963.1 DUF2752 domain-containing protein [Clostridium baratii]MDU1055121.1 DUF2752 domain-containing protein [Clostridium baratii]MDU4912647.1 DUF2752 domain-containing protein [Clostridium baratii]CUP80559.1 Protein of uncharacterised function (DUF2752) [Clostridium baratii]
MIKKIFKYVLFLVLGFSIILAFNIKCIIRTLIGIPCPGCGMTRAWIEAINLNFYEAFKFHPLFLLAPILIILIIIRGEKCIDKYTKYVDVSIVVIIVLFLGVYAFRMYMYFPNEVPMNINKESVLFKAVNLIKSL